MKWVPRPRVLCEGGYDGRAGPAFAGAIPTEAAPVFAVFEGRGFSAAESNVHPSQTRALEEG
jgi:hypothetical protein